MLYIGGNTNLGMAIAATIVLAYVLFENNKPLRVFVIFINMIAYLLVDLYYFNNGSMYPEANTFIDNFLLFVSSLIWLLMAMLMLRKKNFLLIDSLKDKNQILLAKTEELEKFTYIASHDLKSPIRNIAGFLGLIGHNLKSKNIEEALKNLEFAKKGSKRIYTLIEDILELTKFNNQVKKSHYKVDTNEVLNNVLFNLERQIKSANAKVDYENLPSLQGSSSELSIVFQNLIENGIKYNQSKQPEVKIYTDENVDSTNIYFKDNGIGIEEEYKEKIFDLFTRLHTNEEYNGTGIGLGLCKKIINQFNGTISVKSNNRVGSTFILQFPKI